MGKQAVGERSLEITLDVTRFKNLNYLGWLLSEDAIKIKFIGECY